jgi:hypothetical protein
MRRNLRPTPAEHSGGSIAAACVLMPFSDAEGRPEDERSVVREKRLDAGK